MATHRGIETACQAVVELLRDNYDPSAFNRDLEFRVLSTGGFETGLSAGVSVFLYRVMINEAHRTPPGRRGDDWETRTVDVDALVRGAAFLRDPSVGQVRLRHRSEPCLGQHMVSGSPIEWQQHNDHRRGVAHFTFNPSLITRDMADRVFPAADEREAQRRFLATGLDVVQLEPGVFSHIGEHSRRLRLGRRR